MKAATSDSVRQQSRSPLDRHNRILTLIACLYYSRHYRL